MTGYRSDAKAICVLGMHRGGTSAVTGVVHALGAFLGPSGHLMARRTDNPAGFYEHQLLTDLNDELLAALGGTWFEPPVLDAGWEHAPHLDGLRPRAQALLLQDFSDQPLWAWKDPRTCLTLPFWRPLLPATRFVVCVRNPLEVAQSLLARDGIPVARGIDLWMRHTVASLEGHATMPLLVLYDELVNDPAGEVARIAAFLELDDAGSVATRARAHLADNAGLRHHHATFAETCAAPAASFSAVALYAVLQRVVALQRSEALRWDDLRDVAGPFAARAARTHAGERHADGLTSRLAELEAHAAALVVALEARDADLVRARDAITALTSQLGEATSDYARLDALRLTGEAEAAARLSARNAEVAALLLEREAEAAARLSASHAESAAIRRARDADIAALRTAHEAGVAALRAAHDTEVATARTAHDAEIAAVRTAHESDVAALRAVHDLELAALRAVHDLELATLRASHDTSLATQRAAHDADVATWQAQKAADAAIQAGLRGDVQQTRAALRAAGTEVGRLHALLQHLQTPTGLAKLALRAVLPAGVHRRLRSWTGWSDGGPAEP